MDPKDKPSPASVDKELFKRMPKAVQDLNALGRKELRQKRRAQFEDERQQRGFPTTPPRI